MALWVTLVLLAANWAISRLMAPKPDVERAKRARLGDFSVPRAEEGNPVPLFWGRVRIKAPTVVWMGPLSSVGVHETLYPGVYTYRFSMHLILGIPPNESAVLKAFYIGERKIWSGSLDEDSGAPTVDGDLGGSGNGGFASGRLSFFTGDITEDRIAFARLVWVAKGEDTALFVPYRGQTWVMLSGGDPTQDFNVGESPQLEPFSFEVQATARDVDLHGQQALIDNAIADGDANPADVLWDILTSDWSKLGIPKAKMDEQSFLDVADVLEDEQHGYSMVLYNTVDAGQIVREILAQIDGLIYNDPRTGLYVLRLIREDYDIGTLPTFDESNIVEIQNLATSATEETFNEIRVVYTSRAQGYTRRVAFAQDQANIASQGKVRRQEFDYPGVSNKELAGKIAARELQLLSQPLTKARLIFNRDGYNLNPGDLFLFTWTELNITEMVMRVEKADIGELGRGEVVVDCTQDRFAVDYSVYEEDEPQDLVQLDPEPVEAFVITEAPRWLQLQAYNAGRISSVDVQHGYYLAAPGARNYSYVGDLALDEVTFANDTQALTFPGRAQVQATYLRTLEPYDTTTGLVIKNVAGFTPAAATAAQIELGANLLLVGSEIIGYQTATDQGSDQWLLENVHRGLLDTVPVEHAVDEWVYAISLSELSKVGIIGLTADDVVAGRIIPRSGAGPLPVDDAEIDTMTVRMRTLLPYPPADMTIEGGKAPAALEEGGIDLTWRKRDRTKITITRGDAASESVETDTAYDLLGRKGDDADTVLASLVDAALYDELPLGAVGHGTITVGIRASRPNPDNLDLDLTAWQHPEIDIEAPRWRNLMINGRFDAAATPTFWTVTGGDVIASSGAGGLGATGSYAVSDGASVDCDFRQVVDISGYLPERLRAILDFYDKNFSVDADDTVTVDVVALDASDSVLSTTSYGPTVPSTGRWDKHTVDIANLPAGTAKLRVRVLLDSVGVDSNPDSGVTEFILRVGQIGDQLLLNPDFEGGIAASTPTSWTLDSGGFQLVTTTKYNRGSYLQPTDGAAAEMHQDFSIPAGFQWSTAVLECARMNNAASDTGTVTIQARTSGGSVLASATTGAEAISPTNAWVRRRLTVETGAADVIRVIVSAARVAGTALNTCFDDFDVRLHKQLDPAVTDRIALDAPVVQALPITDDAWEDDFPAITAPSGIWAGVVYDGQAGGEPAMTSDEGVLVDQKFVGCWSGTSVVTSAFGFREADDQDIRAISNVGYAAFNAADAFSCVVVLRVDEESFSTARGLCGRLTATAGWSLEISAGGVGVAKLVGATGTKTATGTTVLTDGAPHAVALVYDPATDLLHLIDEAGDHSTSTASGMGEFLDETLAKFRIGRAIETQDTITGQIARVYLWDDHALTAAEFATFWTHATDPSDGSITSYTRTGDVLVTQVGTDADGALLGTFSAAHYAYGYAASLDTGDETGLGLLLNDDTVTRCKSTFHRNTTYWVAGGAPTVARDSVEGVSGFVDGVTITGTSSDRLELQSVSMSGVSTDLYVDFWARGLTAHTAQLQLASSAGVVKGTTAFAVTTSWARYQVTLTGWDAATANAHVYFCPSNGASATLYLSGPTYVQRTPGRPTAFPASRAGTAGTAVKTLIVASSAALTDQFNSEGEIIVEGTMVEAAPDTAARIVDVYNGSTNADRRAIAVQADADLEALHYTGALPANASSTITTTDWSTAWTLRQRWCRAGLLDAAASFAGVVDGATTNYGRTTTWTPTNTPLTEIHLGHDAALDNACANALIRRLTLSVRETRL